MDEFDHGRQLVMAAALIAECLGAQHDQRRAQPLATARDDVLRDLTDQRDVRVQACTDDTVHFGHVIV